MENKATEKELDPSLDQSETKEVPQPVLKCAVCGKTGSGDKQEKPLKSCSQCKSIFYCSVDCQRADWKEHKPICRNADLIIE